MRSRTHELLRLARLSFAALLLFAARPAHAQFSNCDSSGGMTLSGTGRSWQFLDAVGPHSALLGREDGDVEAWVYPLKVFRNFRLTFRVNDEMIPGEDLPHTITTRPESTSIRYVSDTYSVCETWFAPLHDMGAVITVQVDSAEPVQVFASFEPDVAWMWPAGMGAAYSSWDAQFKAFRFGNEEHQFYAVAGSPDAAGIQQAYATDNSSSPDDTFHFGPGAKGSATYRFAVAASFQAQNQAEQLYQKLLTQSPQLELETKEYYERYLSSTLSLSLPDRSLQTAYDWARISTIQGLVDDPYAGEGLVAGFNLSYHNHRPGFSWFFGRDSIWTDLALDSIGDFSTTRKALDFLTKYQRADGRIPHEIPQSVGLLKDWFKDYPYGFASADATPLYVIGIDDYVRNSGDVEFARTKWDSAWRAYQFLRSTYGPNGLPRNFKVGHGWIEGGALLPVSTELYQAGVAAESLQALSDLARLTGKNDVADSLAKECTDLRSKIETSFWIPGKSYYGYALDVDGKVIDRPSVLGTVPMWFGLLDEQHGQSFVNTLAAPDHQADWGMRIISERDPLYFPGGYHFGSIWPLFTGWASVGEYRYHRALPAYANLRANAQLIFDGTLGRATEVLSGRYYTQAVTSTPHQIWSSAMIISPLLRGMMGLSVDALNSSVRFAPHVPADWNDFAIQNVTLGAPVQGPAANLSIEYHRTADELTVQVHRKGSQKILLEFSPSFSVRAKVLSAEVDGKRAAVTSDNQPNTEDQHIHMSVPITQDTTTIRIHVRDDFGIVLPYVAPGQGEVSRSLKIVSEQWNAAHDQLTLQIAGVGGAQYRLPLVGDVTGLTVQGAELTQQPANTLLIAFSPGPSDVFTTKTITLQFGRH